MRLIELKIGVESKASATDTGSETRDFLLAPTASGAIVPTNEAAGLHVLIPWTHPRAAANQGLAHAASRRLDPTIGRLKSFPPWARVARREPGCALRPRPDRLRELPARSSLARRR